VWWGGVVSVTISVAPPFLSPPLPFPLGVAVGGVWSGVALGSVWVLVNLMVEALDRLRVAGDISNCTAGIN
jgi:hypothetical protein